MKNFPNQICEECINNINFLWMFQQTIIDSDREIRRRLFEESLNNKNENWNTTEKTDCTSEIFNEFCDSDYSDDESKELSENCDIEMNEDEQEECTTIPIEEIKIEETIIEDDKEHVLEEIVDGSEEDKMNDKLKKRLKICNICGKSVSYSMQNHMKIHADEPSKCHICGKVYKNTLCLRLHIYNHKREEVICGVCGKSYKSRQNFKLHVQKHEGIHI